MDQGQIVDIAQRYSEAVLNHMKANKIVLYGSQATGRTKEASDIDIAVIVDRIEDDFLKANAQLYKLRRNIDDRIEPILIQEDDDQSGFLEEILKTGKVIYKQERA
jgi:predicted nucleotidyltransferase